MSEAFASGNWIRFPLGTPVTMYGKQLDLSVTVVELRLRRQGDVLSDLELVITPRSRLAAAGLAGPDSYDEDDAVLRPTSGLLASLPTNAATLRRRLGERGPVTTLANWVVVG